VDRLSLVVVQAEKRDVPHRRPFEEAIDHRGKRLLHALSLDPSPRAVKGMQHEPCPFLLGRQGQAFSHRARACFPAELKILPHHSAVDDRREWQGSGFGQDHFPLSDRSLADRGKLDLISRSLLDSEGRACRHPKIVVCGKEQGIRLGPAGRPVLNLDPRLDKVK